MPSKKSHLAFLAANESSSRSTRDLSELPSHGLVKLLVATLKHRGAVPVSVVKDLTSGIVLKNAYGGRSNYPCLLDLWDEDPRFREFTTMRCGQMAAMQGKFVITMRMLVGHLRQLDRPAHKPDGGTQLPGYLVWCADNPEVVVAPADDAPKPVEGKDFIIRLRNEEDDDDSIQ